MTKKSTKLRKQLLVKIDDHYGIKQRREREIRRKLKAN